MHTKLVALGFAAVMLAGCGTNPGDRAASGALIGAAGGAVIGAAHSSFAGWLLALPSAAVGSYV